jgi:hypothetical protein
MVEPGVGSRTERERFSLLTNYSVLEPERTSPFDAGRRPLRKGAEILARSGRIFSVCDALALLKTVRQEGLWATRVSFVYSVGERTVYYVLNNDFDHGRSTGCWRRHNAPAFSSKITAISHGILMKP